MWFSSEKIIKLNKMFKCHKPAFVTEFIFSDNPKSHKLFASGTKAMLTLRLAHKNTSSLHQSIAQGLTLLVFEVF